MELLQATVLFRSLAGQHPGVEVWADKGYIEDGWFYYWIVSRFGEADVRMLAYIRLREGQIERRTYDAEGDEVWTKAE